MVDLSLKGVVMREIESGMPPTISSLRREPIITQAFLPKPRVLSPAWGDGGLIMKIA
jgi:hypothetical protein